MEHHHSSNVHDHHKHAEQHDHRSNAKHHDHGSHHEHMIKDFKKRFWISLILSIPVIILSPMIQEFFSYSFNLSYGKYIQFGLSSFIFLYGGWPFLKGLRTEISDKQPAMMTLIALAISVAYFYSSAVVFGLEGKYFFWELVSLIVIMLLGHWLEMRSIMNASNALQELINILPNEATRVLENGDHKTISAKEIEKGFILLIKPGEKIPADGEITDGESELNESMITGESKSVAKKVGDKVVGGSVNGESSLHIKVTAAGEESYLQQVVNMVQQAQEGKSKTQNFAQKAAGWLFYLALGVGIITFIAWYASTGDLQYAIERMVTVMIISCPHALGLAIPLVVSISTSIAAQKGLLIRNRTAFENCRKIDTILFDKTGTLTTGEFGVSSFQTNSNISKEEVLTIAASLESNSEHPLAAAILKAAKEQDLKLKQINNYSNITGKGIKADIDGTTYYLLAPKYLDTINAETPSDIEQNEAVTTIILAKEGESLGFISLADTIRETSKEAISELRSKGIRSVMATGDNEQVAKKVSEELGIDEFHAGVLPEDKQELVKKLQRQGAFVAMTGDGVNDAPALAEANIGIAVGSGTDVAAETADIVLVSSDPKDILKLIKFGELSYKKMQQNLFWAAGYNIITIPLAAGVLYNQGILLDPAVGAILMSLSTIVVALNAQLLRRAMN